jgi:hypothetical protein
MGLTWVQNPHCVDEEAEAQKSQLLSQDLTGCRYAGGAELRHYT